MTSVLERFLRYVRYDTQSDEQLDDLSEHARSSSCCCAIWPTSCTALGLADAAVDEHGYVMATIPATTPKPDVPTIGFIAHVDTSPEMSGDGRQADRPPRLRRPRPRAARRPGTPCCGWPTTRRSPSRSATTSSPRRARRCSARTTRPASRKSSPPPTIWSRIPRFRTAPIRIAFTPDEEVGPRHRALRRRAVRRRCAYTHGRRQPRRGRERELLGRCDDADLPRLQHPSRLREGPDGERDQGRRGRSSTACRPTACRPRRPTATRASSIRTSLQAGVERTAVRLHRARLRHRRPAGQGSAARDAGARRRSAGIPGARVEIDDRGAVPEHEGGARPASRGRRIRVRGRPARRARGAVARSIRGGTDGSRLSFMGLPTPNLFAGEHNFHSRLEWVSRAGHGEGRRSHRRTVPHLGAADAGIGLGTRGRPAAAAQRSSVSLPRNQPFWGILG